MFDQKSTLNTASSIAPGAAITATENGAGVDLSNFNSATVVFNVGTITDGTHTPSIEESDDNATFTAVDPSLLIGTLTALASNTVQSIGYIGTKRYIRAVSTVTGSPATGGYYTAEVVRGNGRKQP